MIVNKAIEGVATLLKNQTWSVAVGTGTTPAWYDNQTLESELSRLDASVSLETRNLLNDTVLFEATFTFSEIKTLTEYGVFSKTSPPYLLTRVVQAPTGLQANQPIIVRLHLTARRSS